MTMLAPTTLRLSREVLDTLVEIVNTDYSDLFGLTNHGDANNLASDGDCRVFCYFVKLYPLYNCASFRNWNLDSHKKAQINTLHRAKELCKCTGFRTVQHQKLMKQYQLGPFPLDEEKTFLNHMPGHKLSSDMQTRDKICFVLLLSAVKLCLTMDIVMQ